MILNTTSLRNFAGGLVYTLCTGYILAYFSEWTFWLGLERTTPLDEYIGTWLFYSFATFLALIALHYYRARTVWVIFLCGALYGWITEGIIVQTMYDALPLSISVTGLQWHALISVVFGWFYLRRWLMTSDRWTLIGAVGTGLFYAMWSTGWWFNAEPQATTLDVALSMTVYTLLLTVAYAVVARLGDAVFIPTQRAIIGGLVGLVILFAFAVLAQPLALIVFPLCAAFVLIFLRINRRVETGPHQLPAHSIPLRRLLYLLLIPLIVALIYALADSAGFPQLAEPDEEGAPFPLAPFIYLVLLIAGFGVLFYSAWRVWRISSNAQEKVN
ncbi:MAG: hypothetical protein EA396_15205 [Anaerolineaceae bacterium]|nr:MAG: hypothetical protein EA396_15205 [Anaerolineaceae bacterium]